uniref:Serine/threonine-protein phosphatase 4 regulatory subunit 3-like central domain-containing protein n=1 Tax=Strigamia maritima TaxID=126957 RepID=T1IM45_STRMM
MFCDDDTIFDVVGCLEYNQKAKLEYKTHRNYLKNMSNFKEVIPISNPDLLSKIHQTYRMQYILDVVLPTPSITEKDMFSSLSSFIVFNKYDIIKIIQREDFLIPLFTQMKDESIGDEKLRDSIRFLKEYCTFSKSLSPETRHGFFKNLSVLGILEVLEITLGMDNQVIKSNSIDILSDIVEYSPSIVQEFILKQVDSSVDDDQLLINIMIEQMIYDADPESGRAVILMGLLKLLIDPGNMSCQSKFLNMFYQHSMHFLLAPVSANTTGANPSSEDNQTVQLIEWVLELLTFCVLHHRHHIRCYILRKDVLGRVLVLMKSKHKFLVLDALRFMRKIVGLKDDFYYRYMITGNLFLPVVDAFQRNNGRNNLLDSAIIEMFEFIKCQDIKLLCSHLVENFGECFDNVGYVKTFRELKTRYYQHKSKTLSVAGPSIVHQRYRREPREMDKEEETWFSHDDDSDDDMFGTSLQPVVNKYPITLLSRKIELVNFSSSKRTRRKIELVDYDDDDSDEEKDDFSPSKRTRFSK